MRKILFVILIMVSSIVNSQSLVAYYPLNGNANDSIGTNHGVITGCNFVPDSLGNPGSAVHFNGPGNLIEFSNCPIIHDSVFTISMWVKMDVLNQRQAYVSLGAVYDSAGSITMTNPPHEYTFGLHDNDDFICVESGGLNYIKPGPMMFDLKLHETSRWYQITVVHTQPGYVAGCPPPMNNYGYYRFCVDTFCTSCTDAMNPNFVQPNFPLNNSMAFGFQNVYGITQNFLYGTMDDVKFYDYALSDSEIVNLYMNPPNNTITGLKDNSKNTQIQLYPNPSNGNFKIQFLNSDGYSYKIVNSSGKIVQQSSFKGSEHFISLNKKGIYMLVLTNGEKSITQKIFIN